MSAGTMWVFGAECTSVRPKRIEGLLLMDALTDASYRINSNKLNSPQHRHFPQYIITLLYNNNTQNCQHHHTTLSTMSIIYCIPQEVCMFIDES